MAEPPPRHLPPKKEVALALLEGESVFIHLDPRKEGVAVPKSFGKQPQLVLQVGLQLAIRIPDLTIDDEGVSCTLSFNRSPFWCRMPWSAIYALVGPDGRGMLWPEDVPPEVAEQMRSGRAGGKEGKAAKADAAPRKRGRAKLAEVKPDAAEAESGAVGESPAGSPPGASTTTAQKPIGRPALAAVPSPRASDRAPARSQPRDAPLGAHARPAGASKVGGSQGSSTPRQASAGSPPASPPGSTPAGKKPKRELPPYLRVVK